MQTALIAAIGSHLVSTMLRLIIKARIRSQSTTAADCRTPPHIDG
jgi:hypothetical protein